MNDIAEQRPSFFEGEVLSASDLEQLVVYLRDQNARHLLGGHTWGIVAGLQLLEQPAPNGSTDVYLLPGYAVDGYGRAVLVVNPLRLSVDWFNGQPTGPTQIWIRYDEGETNAVRPGFQVCCGDNDAYSRVSESYAIEVGNLSLAKQQTGITISGETVTDARTALRVFNDLGQVLCDSSVPYQDFPLADETKSRWLIPLGEVRWEGGTPGKFKPLLADEDDPYPVIHSRRLRRYLGVVAESVYAADGLIRLRRRTTDVAGTVDQKVIDAACAEGDLSSSLHDDDLENCASGPTPTELVWVEGRLRVTDDVRILAPGRLELRDANGTNYFPEKTKGSSATFLQRTDHIEDEDNNADLAIVLSKPAEGNNRLLIQQAMTALEPTPCQAVQFESLTTKVAVLDSGEVGIGTDDPDQLLTIENPAGPAYIHLKDGTANTESFVGADEFGGVLTVTNESDLRFRTGGTDLLDEGDDGDDATDEQIRMIILATGEVGINTTEPSPAHELTVHDTKTASILVRTDAPHELLLRAYDGGALVAANTEDDSLILGAGGDNEFVWDHAEGRVGINTSNPGHDLSVAGVSEAEISVFASQGTDKRLLLGVDSDGTYVGGDTEHDLRLRTNAIDRVFVKTTGRVGIGTDAPKEKLDVRGSISLGATGQYLAVGGITNWAVIAGNVDKDGTTSVGAGFSCDHSANSKKYVIEFDDPFPDTPVVTASLRMDPPAVGNPPILLVHDVSGDGFTVTMWGGSENEHLFCFHAFCKRN